MINLASFLYQICLMPRLGLGNTLLLLQLKLLFTNLGLHLFFEIGF